MFKSPVDNETQEALKFQSNYIAIVIRNAIDEFNTEEFTNAQRKELNRRIRNAVYTALFSMEYYKDSVRASEFLQSQVKMVPWYWEEPELLGGIGGK